MSPILWRRLDRPGHEAAWLRTEKSGWRLLGSAVFAHEGQPCWLAYTIVCDHRWQTRSAEVSGWVGPTAVKSQIHVEAEGAWQLNGERCPALSGCIDVDLNFSPSTNLLPIRRLNLPVGEQAAVRAAWLRFPSFRLEPLDQIYRRISDRSYRYESSGGSFVARLETNGEGFVTEYPGFWAAESTD